MLKQKKLKAKLKKKLKTKYKTKVKKKYEKKKCAFHEGEKRCTNNAVGKSQLCKKHGGRKIDPALALTPAETLKEVQIVQTKFKPAVHPLQFINLSREGLSLVEIAAHFSVGVHTIEAWAEKYSEMAIAYEIGNALHEAWWLAKGKDGLDSRSFNTGLFKFLTGNKLGYADKIESKNMNMNMNAHGVLVVPAKMNEKEWEQSFE